MKDESNATSPEAAVRGLKDTAVRYDLAKLVKEAEAEFDINLSSQELVDQASIGKFFNLKERLHARS